MNEQPKKNFILSEENRNALATYLGTRPLAEVLHIFNALISLPELPSENKEVSGTE